MQINHCGWQRSVLTFDPLCFVQPQQLFPKSYYNFFVNGLNWICFLNTYMIAFCQMCWENRGRWRNGDDWGEDIGVGAIEAFEWKGDCQEWCFWLGMRQWKHHHFQKCKSSRARALHVPNCLYVWYAIWLFPFVFGMHFSFFLVFWNLGFLRFGKLCGFSEDLSRFLV